MCVCIVGAGSFPSPLPKILSRVKVRLLSSARLHKHTQYIMLATQTAALSLYRQLLRVRNTLKLTDKDYYSYKLRQHFESKRSLKNENLIQMHIEV